MTMIDSLLNIRFVTSDDRHFCMYYQTKLINFGKITIHIRLPKNKHKLQYSYLNSAPIILLTARLLTPSEYLIRYRVLQHKKINQHSALSN